MSSVGHSSSDREGQIEALKSLANRKLGIQDRLGFGTDVDQLAAALDEGEIPTTIACGILEGSQFNTVYVMATHDALVLANAPLRKASAFVHRLPYREIQAIEIEPPGMLTRFNLLAQRQANVVIRSAGQSMLLKRMEKHRAEEIRDLVEERAMPS
jgi:hypothetical protein